MAEYDYDRVKNPERWLERERDRLVAAHPTTDEEWAEWYKDSGEMWSYYSTRIAPGRGHGSAIHDYSKAAQKYRKVGNTEAAGVCERMAESHARRWDLAMKEVAEAQQEGE